MKIILSLLEINDKRIEYDEGVIVRQFTDTSKHSYLNTESNILTMCKNTQQYKT